jgi:hypothetical protein
VSGFGACLVENRAWSLGFEYMYGRDSEGTVLNLDQEAVLSVPLLRSADAYYTSWSRADLETIASSTSYSALSLLFVAHSCSVIYLWPMRYQSLCGALHVLPVHDLFIGLSRITLDHVTLISLDPAIVLAPTFSSDHEDIQQSFCHRFAIVRQSPCR